MSRWSNKYVIGLTGNIATGKSVVRQMLQHSGAYTIDADSLGHQVMMPNAPAYKPVVKTFGKFILGSDGRINRQLLGQIVFSNPEALKKLEAITHPIIRQAVDALVKRSKQRVVVIEAIKLLDGELKDWVDEVWVVNASRKTQFRRLVTKRKMSQDDAKKRILAQRDQSAKVKAADVVIENDGDVEKTWQQVQTEWSRIKKQLIAAQQAKKQQRDQARQQASVQATPAPEADTADDTIDDMSPEDQVQDIGGLNVRRGMPKIAQAIADFINAHGKRGDDLSRIDVMMSFGEKSYFVAQDENENVVALIGWTVENLVTRVDEFYVKPGVPVQSAVHAMIVAVEDGSKALQSEAAFIFLPSDSPEEMIAAFKADGYDSVTLKEIKIPVWREAVEEQLREGERIVLWKQLRQDRVLQPI